MKQAVLAFITTLTAEFEGFRSKVYKCPAGFDTIGYGRNIKANPLSAEEKALLKNGEVSKEVALEWLKEELEKCYNQLDKEFAWFKTLDIKRAGALTDMVYNLGFGGFKSFKNTIKYLEAKDFAQAANNMEQSKWFRQVKRRGVFITNLVRNG
ncbi:lysozyme [Helicobacter sp. MIT 11-5569]|uniref:glycoside hydrolase family protein n=1 Tax=Helicobacter sp. MIT 11-5569 TaxID=1548151 RepID=UPI000690E7F6|nr:glycoside hydrolase family protein [Helicobacter sp. MIT 11-5569]TLD83960.1 lysozyme [Helicobacter sp. MIT 11-5569]